ncbi:hypothetical protein ABB02_00207 [Clostridiaceae bacterium JG1575]|nr:hypothetical protein ABB02_00207 [Clostridiaceae bacterium JG1575]
MKEEVIGLNEWKNSNEEGAKQTLTNPPDDRKAGAACQKVLPSLDVTRKEDQLAHTNPQAGQTTDELNQVENSEYASNDQFRKRPE